MHIISAKCVLLIVMSACKMAHVQNVQVQILGRQMELVELLANLVNFRVVEFARNVILGVHLVQAH